ncbi:sulfite exporter TauE/SafE family protein [Gammaproteobacteria bacterium]|nr:sulfite exporter TauE/SafE family protein [Gammaproteobacteria bacterium]
MTVLCLFLMMGIFLGLVGAGGSILSIPILTYGVGMPMVKASSFSLAIIGFVAMIAVVRVRHTISFKVSLLYALPTVLAMLIARMWLLSVVRRSVGGPVLQQMLECLLVLFMVGAAYSLLKRHHEDRQVTDWSYALYFTMAFLLGLLVGMLGAGGGFLLIPLLVLSGHFDLPRAINLSYVLIALNSMTGFVVDDHAYSQAEWLLLVGYVLMSLMGMHMGIYARQYVDVIWITRVFAFILIINSFILSVKLVLELFL